MDTTRSIQMPPVLRLATMWWPAVVAIVLLVVITYTVVGREGRPIMAMLGILALTAALAISRRFPMTALIIDCVAVIILANAAMPNLMGPFLVAMLTLAISVASLHTLRLRLIALAPMAVVAASGIAMQLQALSSSGMMSTCIDGACTAYFPAQMSLVERVGLVAWGLPVIGALIAWATGFSIGMLRDRLAAEQVSETAQARTAAVESELRDERLRIDLTHDFHDLMAHSLAVLAAQAEGLRLTHQQHPERIEPVLTTISDTARLALVEVRQLLEQVDDDARRPQPTVADIPAVIDQVRSAGPRIAFRDAGRHGALPKLGEVAAYRIVQEALTNALRHGGSDIDIDVDLHWTGPGLSISVSSPIVDRAGLAPAGRGITGMHERAKLAGGWVEIDAEGKFIVAAYLPYAPPPAAHASAPLEEDDLPTVPVALQQSTHDTPVAPWIAARARETPHPPHPGDDWSHVTRVDLETSDGADGDGSSETR